jgi:signal transduction histidine kinase
VTITQRLIALVTVPLLFTGGFAAWALTTTGREAMSASRLMDLVAVAGQAGVLADSLQRERAAATAVLLGGSPFEQLEAYRRSAEATDDAIGRYRAVREDLSGAPAAAQTLVDRIDDQIRRLPELREDVREGPTAALSAVTFTYRISIADLVSLRETVAQADGGSAELLASIRAAGLLSRATEFAARSQVEVMQTAALGQVSTPVNQQSLLGIRAGYREALESFAELAPAPWLDWLDHALTGPDVLTAQRLEDLVARTPVGSPISVDIEQWSAATRDRVALLHEVERRIDEAVSAEIARSYDGKLFWVAVEAAVVIIALAAAIVTAIAQSRSMIRRLRALAGAAHNTAFVSLPNTVEQLRAIDSQIVDPEAFAQQAIPPVTETGTDEIADVSRAFVAVHRQAIHAAADLANSRAGLSQILLHLARRSQRLVGVLIRELDGAERGEQDPERLATLFRLDQLATRMGRYNDNLLVMGGQTASRVDAPDVALETVLRGAQSKIEHYQRIRIAPTPPSLMVRGVAVHDVMNLIAELLDNATQFSSPQTSVQVAAGIYQDWVSVTIQDAGVGIPRERLDALNDALAAPPAIDVSAIRSMGLTVVAHIAARLGVVVRLAAARHGGTLVALSMPGSVCRPPGPAGPVRQRPPDNPTPASISPHWVPGPRRFGTVRPFSWFQASPLAAPSTGATRGVAHEGWAAAARTATPAQGLNTAAGLPRRPPMANLVPGAVPDGADGVGAVYQRDPALVAASVAAFALGSATSRARHRSG